MTKTWTEITHSPHAGNTHEKDDWEDEERRARERSEMGRDSAQPDAADFARRAAMNDI